jgi:hypothetical protein
LITHPSWLGSAERTREAKRLPPPLPVFSEANLSLAFRDLLPPSSNQSDAQARRAAGRSREATRLLDADSPRREGKFHVLRDPRGRFVIKTDSLSEEQLEQVGQQVELAFEFLSRRYQASFQELFPGRPLDLLVLSDPEFDARVLTEEDRQRNDGFLVNGETEDENTVIVRAGRVASRLSDERKAEILAHELNHVIELRQSGSALLPSVMAEGWSEVLEYDFDLADGFRDSAPVDERDLGASEDKGRLILGDDLRDSFDQRMFGALFFEFLERRLGSKLGPRMLELTRRVRGGQPFEEAFGPSIGRSYEYATEAFAGWLQATEKSLSKRLARSRWKNDALPAAE